MDKSEAYFDWNLIKCHFFSDPNVASLNHKKIDQTDLCITNVSSIDNENVWQI